MSDYEEAAENHRHAQNTVSELREVQRYAELALSKIPVGYGMAEDAARMLLAHAHMAIVHATEQEELAVQRAAKAYASHDWDAQ